MTTFDFEEPDRAEAGVEAVPADHAALRPGPVLAQKATDQPARADMRGRRLIVLFFDLSSMEPEAVTRAVHAAHDCVDQKISRADLIAVASFSTSLRVDQDFTTERAAIDGALDRFGGTASQGFEEGSPCPISRATL